MKRPTVGILAAIALAVATTSTLPAHAQEARVPISSTGVDLDYRNGITHYFGTVRVVIPGVLQLSCEDLVATQSPNTNRLDNLVATTNVVIDVERPARKAGDPPIRIRAVGDRAVFTATNNTVTLTGPNGGTPRVTMPQLTTRGDTITYNLATDRVSAMGHHLTEINPGLFGNGLFNRTNKPARK